MGLREQPGIQKRTIGKMGLKDVPGIVIEDTLHGKYVWDMQFACARSTELHCTESEPKNAVAVGIPATNVYFRQPFSKCITFQARHFLCDLRCSVVMVLHFLLAVDVCCMNNSTAMDVSPGTEHAY